jgi:hypothetical protein
MLIDERMLWHDDFEPETERHHHVWANPGGNQTVLGPAQVPPPVYVPGNTPVQTGPPTPPDIQAALDRASQVLDYVNQHPTMQPEVKNMILQRVVDDLIAAIAAQAAPQF